MNLYQLEEPKQWRAGFLGEGEGKKPFFFSCADCETSEPVIFGFMGTSADWDGIALIPAKSDMPYADKFVNPALFCEACYLKRLEAADDWERKNL